VSKGVQIALAALSIGAGLALVLTLGSAGEGTFRYYSDVGSFTSAPSAEVANLPARVHGFVVAGSIAKNLEAGHVDFHVADRSFDQPGAKALPVRFLGIDVPDLFKDGAEVVVEGHFASGTFLAEKVMAKCPSKYEAKPPGQST
jgi:cytochrome c-type biogenesis protein CcmE